MVSPLMVMVAKKKWCVKRNGSFGFAACSCFAQDDIALIRHGFRRATFPKGEGMKIMLAFFV